MTTSLVSAPWATPTDVDALAPDRQQPAGGWEPSLAQASDLLYQLTGRQWRGPGTSRVQIVPAGVGGCLRPPVPGWVPVPIDLAVGGGDGTGAWWGRQLTVVALPSSPVAHVDAVQVADTHGELTALDPASYRLRDRAGHLERLDGHPWPVDGTLLVTYTHGITPPLGGIAACVSLAVELAAAGTGDGTSRIANTATVTREGVTLAAVDLRAAITGGLTGLPEVDLWITSVNPKRLARRGSAWSPDHGVATRVPAPASPYPGVQPMALTFGTPSHPTPTTTDVQRRLGRRRARRAARSEE